MTTHIMSLTYAPKIEAVKSGRINQTIRLVRSSVEKKKGDKLILHTWEGKPYRSKWGWRMETRLIDVFNIKRENGRWNIQYAPDDWMPIPYDMVEQLAYLDGIEPPTPDGLESTLKQLNGLKSLNGLEFQVIRWDASRLQGEVRQ